jgi:hypothetical protein
MRNSQAYYRSQLLIRELREQLRHELRVGVAGSYQWHLAKQRLDCLLSWPGLPE